MFTYLFLLNSGGGGGGEREEREGGQHVRSFTSFNLSFVVFYFYFYVALFSALEETHCSRMWFYMSDSLFIARFLFLFLNIHRSGVFTALAWLVPHETAAVSARSVYTIQPCIVSFHAKPQLFTRIFLPFIAHISHTFCHSTFKNRLLGRRSEFKKNLLA